MKKFFFGIFTAIVLLHINSIYSNKNEKIYAVMITGKDEFHEFLARRSVKSFLEQTYPNKHLIIINDGNYTLNYKEKSITEIKINEKKVLGALRNIGLDKIPNNGIWVQWDDDDYHHPNLMQEQYKHLISHKADLCFLTRQVQYCFRINSCWNVSRDIEGTVMCRKRDIRYPEIARSEDVTFLQSYKQKYKCVGWLNPSYYYLRFIHGHNTWSEGHFYIPSRKSNKWDIEAKSKEYLEKVLEYYKEIHEKSS